MTPDDGPKSVRRTAAGSATRLVQSVSQWMRHALRRAGGARRAAGGQDPWIRLELEPPLTAFGPGAVDDFVQYLGRDSSVVALTPVEIAQWLLDCRYADDATLLGDADVWQHPCAFEVVRCGDCEDFALWAWRKLVEAAYDTEFVVGVRRRPDGVEGRHAWVTYKDSTGEFLLDGVERSAASMIRPVAGVRAEYEPQVGVGADGRPFVYAGLYRTDWGRAMKLRPR